MHVHTQKGPSRSFTGVLSVSSHGPLRAEQVGLAEARQLSFPTCGAPIVTPRGHYNPPTVQGAGTAWPQRDPGVGLTAGLRAAPFALLLLVLLVLWLRQPKQAGGAAAGAGCWRLARTLWYFACLAGGTQYMKRPLIFGCPRDAVPFWGH